MGGYALSRCDRISDEDIKKKLNLHSDLFFAYIGTIEPRKNISRLVKAFELFNDGRTDKYYLVLAGKFGWKTKPITQIINRSRFRKYILLPGYIDEQEKIYLMSRSTAFVFPSNYEGFGIPILEAMSCGSVVITASNSSLMEIGGSLPVYAVPNDEYGIAKAMSQCVAMNSAEREERISTGRSWASNFDWRICADMTRKIIEA